MIKKFFLAIQRCTKNDDTAPLIITKVGEFLRLVSPRIITWFEKLYQTHKRGFHPIPKLLKITLLCLTFFNPLLGFWKSDETLFLVFDILCHTFYSNSKILSDQLYQTEGHLMEQRAEQSVYRCHLLHQTSGGQVLEGQSDNTKLILYQLTLVYNMVLHLELLSSVSLYFPVILSLMPYKLVLT